MRKLWVAATFVLMSMICCLSAMAEPTFTYLPASSIGLSMPYGISYTTQYDQSTGTLKVTIDTQATDWAYVATTGYNQSNEAFNFGIRIQNPNGDSARIHIIGAHEIDEDAIAYMIENDEGYTGTGAFSTQWWLGSYNEEKALFIPDTTVTNPFFNIFWNESDPTTIYRVNLQIDYTDADALNVLPAYLPSSNISANILGLADITSTVTDGSITYLRTSQQATAPNLQTAFVIPEQNGHNDWTLYQLQGGSENILPSNGTMNGLPRYILHWPATSDNISTVIQYTTSFVLKDENGIVQAAYNLNITLEQGPLTLWPENPPNGRTPINPVPSDRMQYEVSESVPGIDLAYEDGLLHMIVDNQKLLTVTNAAMDSVTARTLISPYPGARYFAVAFTGAQNLYDSSNYNNFYREPNQDERIECADGFEWESNYFYQISYEGGDRILYKSANYDNNNLGGMLPILFWYENIDDETPMCVEYFAVIEDSVTLQYKSSVVDDENSIPASDSNKPILVDRQGQYANCQLKVTAFPTNENLMYYELAIVDDANRYVPLHEELQLYIPYPAGYDQYNSQNLSFVVSHFLADGSEVAESFSGDQVQQTPYGLCVTVSSLSPFTLAWEKHAASYPMPKTGDNSQPLLWLFMMLGASGGLSALWFTSRKRKRSWKA